MGNEQVMHVCDVCLLLDNDSTEKLCRFCGGCQAWICIPCEGQYQRRADAMLKKARMRASQKWYDMTGKKA